MVTKDESSSSSSSSTFSDTTTPPAFSLAADPDPAENTVHINDEQNDGAGFFSLLVKSVFEPGANAAVVLAMNTCFFLLLLTLFALAFLTGWNKHVLMLLGVTGLLWASMVWFVMQVTQLQTRPDNMPPPPSDLLDSSHAVPETEPGAGAGAGPTKPTRETRKER